MRAIQRLLSGLVGTRDSLSFHETIGAPRTQTRSRGFFYPGVIDAVADPDSSKVSALMNAAFSKTHTANDLNGVAHDYTFNFNANGQFDNVKVVANQQNSTTSSARLRGTASLTYTTENDPNNPDFAAGDSGGPIKYKVRGFKQSDSSS